MKLRLFKLYLIPVIAYSAIFASAQSFTLQQVMSAPFSSELSAAPKGERFVWISNQEGKRNLWVFEDGNALALTHYDSDNGIDLGDIAWTPDGESILYVRGGDFEFPSKASPNPALVKDGVEQEIWIVSAKGGDPHKLAAGRAPAVSSNGKTVAYLLKDQVWTIDLSAMDAKPALLFQGRGEDGSLTWSPDGTQLAFVSHRGDHSFIGIYSFATSSVTYIDPGTEHDDEPVWSPDGRKIAFLRIPPDTTGIDFKPRRTGQPWSIRIADVATGEGHEIWHAHEGAGSAFHELAAGPQLYWTASDRIVFPWEATGWIHLYAVSTSGGEAVELTPGSFEIEHAAMTPDHKAIVYSSNQDDIDRRHIWQVSATGGGPKELTSGLGIEVFPAVAASGTIAVLRSDARIPIRPAVMEHGGQLRDLASQLIPADFPAAKLVVPVQVILAAADGMQIHGQLFLPAGDSNRRHAALIFFHGGSRRQMLLGWHYKDYYSNAYAMNQYLASLGYVVLSVNYRSGIGYGLDFREALNYGAAGASEFNDVLGAGLYLRSRADVDPARIGVWGGSYGGYLTALALSRASDLFAAGVDFHGVHDWNLELNIWQPAYDPNADPNAARLAWESSPLASVKGWRSPVLLMQGDDDRNVQFSQTVRLAAALRAQGTPFEERVFPDEIHDFMLHKTWVTAYGYEAEFFGKYLKPQQ